MARRFPGTKSPSFPQKEHDFRRATSEKLFSEVLVSRRAITRTPRQRKQLIGMAGYTPATWAIYPTASWSSLGAKRI